MIKINLKPPSEALRSALIADMNDKLPSYVPSDYLLPGVADGIYFHDRVFQLGKEEYQPFFDNDFCVMGMLLRPDPWITTENAVASCYKPHCDAERTVGINFIIDQGGSNVTTTFYSKTRESSDLKANVVDYDQVTPIKSYCYEKEVWHTLDGSRYHSVENIESDRLILLISFRELNFNEFLIKYSHLVEKVL